MQKRTNTDKISVFTILRNVLPVVLAAVLLFQGSFQTAANRMLYISSALTFPFERLGEIEAKKEEYRQPQSVYITGENAGAETVPSVSNKISSVPKDIQKLVNDAENQYKDSSNDGSIREVNYKTQNATSEYNGIYIRNTTKNQSVDIGTYFQKKCSANIRKNEPAVLIYHTHTSETYELLDRGYYTNARSTRSENSGENMVRVGDEICRVLEENGYKVIHDKTVYDETLSGAYERSRENVSRILKENPSVQIVLDIHRDSIYQKDGTRIKPTAQINGTKTAQITVISGCECGTVTDFPNWEKNLVFAFNLQAKLTEGTPELVRPLLFCERKYNMDLTACALQIEIGSDANTLSEAVYSAQLFATSLSDLMKEYEV